MSDIIDIGPKKWWATAAMCLAAIAFSLDLTVLNLALPTLSTSLHASTGQLQWIADAYALILAVLTLPAGMLGDRFGRKRLIIMALIIFGTASALCAYSTTVTMLIASRLLLGVGAAFILPLAMSIMPIYFRPEERTKALAILMGGVFLAYPLGPILGGWLLTHFWWGSVFLINVPVVLIAIAAIGALLPESKSSKKHRIDFTGIALSSLGLTGITYGAIEAESNGWSNHWVIASLVAGVVLLIAFFYWEKRKTHRREDSLIDIHLFESPAFTWGTILMTTVNFSLFGLLFGLPQYLEVVRGYKPLTAGYYLLPMIVGLMIGSVGTARLGKKLDTRIAVAIGYALMAIGLLIGTRTTLGVHGIFIVLWTGLIGLGLGVAMPNVATAAISPLSAEHSAAGTALISAVRQVGGTLGIALLGTVLGVSYRSQLHTLALPSTIASTIRSSVTAGTAVANKMGNSLLLHIVRLAFVHGMTVMLFICGCIALTAMVLGLSFLPRATKKMTGSKLEQ